MPIALCQRKDPPPIAYSICLASTVFCVKSNRWKYRRSQQGVSCYKLHTLSCRLQTHTQTQVKQRNIYNVVTDAVITIFHLVKEDCRAIGQWSIKRDQRKCSWQPPGRPHYSFSGHAQRIPSTVNLRPPINCAFSYAFSVSIWHVSDASNGVVNRVPV